MKKSFIITIITFFVALSVSAITVSDYAQISLLTCSPGNEVYQKFGHTAIRYTDKSAGIDVVYNYGIFNFSESGFYLKFIKGETYYMLGRYDTNLFIEDYGSQNIMVTERIINLSKQQKQQLINSLEENYLPQNRYYLYNFIFDNCATRPRDKIISLFDQRDIIYKSHFDIITFRELLDNFTGSSSWLKFGTDLLLGKGADNIATRSESMFLPEELSKQLGGIEIADGNGTSHHLMANETIFIPSDKVKEKAPFIYSPIAIITLFFLIVLLITLLEIKLKKQFKLLDTLLFLITGLGGITIFYLIFFSIHPLVSWNFNILWCNPLYLLVAFLIWIRGARKTVAIIQIINILSLLASTIVIVFFYQMINIAAIPFILTLFTRSIYSVFLYQSRRDSKKRYLR